MRLTQFTLSVDTFKNKHYEESKIFIPLDRYQQLSRSLHKCNRKIALSQLVLSVSSKTSTVFRILGDQCLSENFCALGVSTRTTLGVKGGDELHLRVIYNRLIGNFLYFKTHPNDSIRQAMGLASFFVVGMAGCGFCAGANTLFELDGKPCSFFSIPSTIIIKYLKKMSYKNYWGSIRF